MSIPRVSVICIFLDEEKYLAELVESVLAQGFQDFELVLVDDGSTDRSPQIAREYAASDPRRIRYLDHPGHENRGTSASRNLGLRNTSGPLVVFTDADDVWRPNRLHEQVAILDAHPEVGMVCGTANYWRSWDGGPDRLVPTGHLVDAASFPPETTLSLYPLGSASAPCDPMIRRSVIQNVGGWEESFGGFYDDIAFHAKVYLECGVWLSSSIWYDYRLHPESCCATTSAVHYRATRRRFLDWFESYIAEREVPDRSSIARAIARAKWPLDHPVASGALRRIRRVAQLMFRGKPPKGAPNSG